MTPTSKLRPQAAPALFELLSDSAISRAALNACGVPLCLLEASKRAVSHVNAAFSAYFGFAGHEALGKSLASLLLRGDEALLQRVLAEGHPAWQLSLWSKDGTLRNVQLSLGRVHAVDGRHTHWVLTFADRNEVEQLRAELEAMKTLGVGSLGLRLEPSAEPARGAQQSRVEVTTADELHAERKPARTLHQR